MRVLLVLAAVAVATATVIKDDTTVFIGKENMGELHTLPFNNYIACFHLVNLLIE